MGSLKRQKLLDNEDELVALLKTKDEASFRYLYDVYSGALFRIILLTIPERELACDILQEVFLKIWRNIDSYDNAKGRLFTWMLNLTRNLSIDMVRSAAYQNNKRNVCLTDTEYFNRDLLLTHMNTDSIGLKKFIKKLKPKYQILIDLAYFKGYTYKQITQIENLPLGTVKTRLRLAIIQLRNYLI